MRIVFHGEAASAFGADFAALLDVPAEVTLLPDALRSDAERAAYAAAEVIVSFRFDASLPHPAGLRLLHMPGAGLDKVDFAALPAGAIVCNCFGHEQPIAEYVLAAMLNHAIPFARADADLRRGDWTLRGGVARSVHGELAGRSIGILGYGHIGKAVALRAKAFAMTVHVANRTAIAPGAVVDRYHSLAPGALAGFWAACEFFAVTLPLAPETTGIVSAAALAAMPRSALVVNVGRGALIDETALYAALRERRIAGAVIDTWYRYPSAAQPDTLPASQPFHELDNVVMTPHLSGWTQGTIDRRRRAIAANVRRRFAGEPCVNVASPPATP